MTATTGRLGSTPWANIGLSIVLAWLVVACAGGPRPTVAIPPRAPGQTGGPPGADGAAQKGVVLRRGTPLAAAAELPGPQPLLSFTEIDQDGGTHTVRAVDKAGIVDINSRITIRLNRDSLRVAVLAVGDTALPPSAVIQRIDSLRALVQNGLAALAAYAKADSQPLHARLTPAESLALERPRRRLAEIYRAAFHLAPPGSALEAAENHALDSVITRTAGNGSPGIIPMYSAVLAVVRLEADNATARLDSALRTNGIYVQLGAALVTSGETRPIHLPGFDTYTNGALVVVDRWSLAMPASAQADYASAAAAAKQANESNGNALASYLKQQVSRNGGPLIDSLRNDVDRLKTCGTGLTADLARTVVSVSPHAADALDTLMQFAEYANGLRTRYAASGAGLEADPVVASTTLIADATQLVARLKDLAAAVDTLGIDQARLDNAAATRAVANSIRTAWTACKAPVAALLVSELQQLLESAKSTLGFPAATGALETFDDHVLKLSIDSIPNSVSFSLTTTGSRSKDDMVVVALRAGRGTRPPEDLTPQRQLLIERVLLHVEVFGGLVFVSPFDHKATAVKSFQAAPSYSFVLKPAHFGDIRSRGAFMRFFDPGIGLNLSAVDLDKNDQLELAMSGVLSGFHDLLQLGVGWDLNLNRSFYLIGLRLPLPSGSLPGAAAGGNAQTGATPPPAAPQPTTTPSSP